MIVENLALILKIIGNSLGSYADEGKIIKKLKLRSNACLRVINLNRMNLNLVLILLIFFEEIFFEKKFF